MTGSASTTPGTGRPKAPPGLYWRKGKLVPRPPSKLPLRGFVEWTPRPGGRPAVQLEIALAVIAEYKANLPLTVRQIYYRSVGKYGRPKSEDEYETLIETISRARRARLIRFEHIHDDDNDHVAIGGADDDPVGDFIDGVARSVEYVRLNRQDGQPAFIEVHCEAAGMKDQLEQVTWEYGIPVVASGGQLTLSARWRTAQRAAERVGMGITTEILHLGDADEAGFSITENAIEDPAAFVAALVPHPPLEPMTGERLALTEDQIDGTFWTPAHGPLPPDPTGKPGFQLEALAPDEIAQILREAIEARLDLEAYKAVLERENEVRDELRQWIGGKER